MEKLKFGISLIGGSLLIAGFIVFNLTMRIDGKTSERGNAMAASIKERIISAREQEAKEVPEDWPSATE